MQRSGIRSARDTTHLQSGPYTAFMSHAGIHDVLADAAGRYAQRRALTFMVDADPATPPRMWTYAQLLADVRRTARLFRRLAGDEPSRIAMLLPRRIDVLPAIPMTAIGKVFKPRLRMLACERVLNERLERAGLASAVRVRIEDAGAGPAARFAPVPGAAAPDRERIADLMRAFAIDWRCEP